MISVGHDETRRRGISGRSAIWIIAACFAFVAALLAAMPDA
jgi:hypothetical protein